MKVNTGKGSISLMTLIAIWSISLTVNLPGLAITPMLGNLDKIFPHTSELEIQLLTVLPNLFIIPFVLLSGKLSWLNHCKLWLPLRQEPLPPTGSLRFPRQEFSHP